MGVGLCQQQREEGQHACEAKCHEGSSLPPLKPVFIDEPSAHENKPYRQHKTANIEHTHHVDRIPVVRIERLPENDS